MPNRVLRCHAVGGLAVLAFREKVVEIKYFFQNSPHVDVDPMYGLAHLSDRYPDGPVLVL